MKTINKQQAAEIIKENKRFIFSALFVKKDNTHRLINARLGVKYIKKDDNNKSPYDPSKHNLLPVYDMHNKGFRMLNLATLKQLNINKTKYIIK